MKNSQLLSRDRDAWQAKVAILNERQVDNAYFMLSDAEVGVPDVLRKTDLPKSLPENLREQILHKAKESIRLAKEVNDMLEELQEIAQARLDVIADEQERKAPRCECCGHKL